MSKRDSDMERKGHAETYLSIYTRSISNSPSINLKRLYKKRNGSLISYLFNRSYFGKCCISLVS